jgi:hypothetical protein
MEDHLIMIRRDAATLSCLVLALAAGLAGCQDRDIGTIKADRGAVEQLQRANSDRPSPTSKNGRKRPDANDLSPKVRGGEAQR